MTSNMPPALAESTLERNNSRTEDSDRTFVALSSSAPIIRSELWLSDGNIVLEAENTQFRFYRGLLARHSTFFRNMFDVMFPPSNGPLVHAEDIVLVEECPVVCLADAAEDVSYMLYFLVEARSFDLVPSIANLRSAMCMGHKYTIPSLWNDAVQRLRYEFPSRLEDYQDSRNYDDNTRFYLADGETLHDLVELVQEMNIQSVQPALFCHVVSSCSLDSLTNDASSPLSLENRVMLLTGRARLKDAALRDQYQSRTGRSSHCTRPECAEGHTRLQASLLCRVAFISVVIPGFEEWTDRDTRLYGRELCDECVLQVQLLTEETQRKTWDRLPSLFGLPNWEDLGDPTVVASR